jgi:hypothetical protein
MGPQRFEMMRSGVKRKGRDRGGSNLSISVEGLVKLPIYPFIMVVTETRCIGKGEQKGHLTSTLPERLKFRIFE